MSATIVDTTALLKLVYSSLAAGVGLSVIFSLAIYGATRSSDMRRAGRSGASGAFAAVAGIALVLSAGIVVYGLILVVHKS